MMSSSETLLVNYGFILIFDLHIGLEHKQQLNPAPVFNVEYSMSHALFHVSGVLVCLV